MISVNESPMKSYFLSFRNSKSSLGFPGPYIDRHCMKLKAKKDTVRGANCKLTIFENTTVPSNFHDVHW